ncbi:MAG: signal peptidase II [Verrucomicrobiales bacterium]|jgi:signal peptidase II|nr:signal peptidase II [Verrucomicrobiales bacterium]
MNHNRPRWYFWTLLVTLLAADQLSKWLVVNRLALYETRPIVSGLLNLTHLTNDGIAWGLLRGNNLALAAIVSVIVLAALWYARRLDWRPAATNLLAATISAGAIGNLLDRFTRGHVIDFVDCLVPLTNGYHWPAFNIADSCITVSVAWLCYRAVFQRELH